MPHPAARPDAVRPLPSDNHVHSEWSWDAPDGDMVSSCERAIAIGLPSIAFTEHVDHTVWRVDFEALSPGDHLADVADDTGSVHPPPLDVDGYLAQVEDCRRRFPELAILTGVELGEPHRHGAQVRALLSHHEFDRVLGSVHSLRTADGGYTEPPGLFADLPTHQVLTDYLDEVRELVASSIDFEVLAHIDYPLRSWPRHAPPPALADCEEAFREVFAALAASGRAVELNTRTAVSPVLLRWFAEEGGKAISFGSDAHTPAEVARGFADAADLAGSCGFSPGGRPHDLWRRGR